MLERMRQLMLGTAFYMAPDGEGSAGAGAGAGAGSTGAGEWSPPEGLPEEYRGTDAADTLGKLMPAFADLSNKYKGARDTIAKYPAPPKSADEYTFAPTDKTRAFFPEGKGDDKMMGLARQAAHASGLSNDAFNGFINGIYESAAAEGLLGDPYDAAREVTSYKTARGLDDRAASAELTDLKAFADGLAEQLDIPAAQKNEVVAELTGLTDFSAGNLLLRAMRERLNRAGVRIEGKGEAAGELSKEELKKLDGDPRIDPANRDHADPAKRFDPALRKQYDDAYTRHYGGGRAA